MEQDSTIQKIVHCLESADNFIISTHIHPDGDSISSALVIGHILSMLKKTYAIVIDDEITEKYNFLPGISKINSFSKCHHNFTPHVLIIVDASNIDRIGKCAQYLEQCKISINIDHHARNYGYADMNWIDGCASSTVEIAYKLFQYFSFPLTPDLATLIYVGIICDTGRFRFQNTTHLCMETAAQMLKTEISAYQIADQMYFKKHSDSLRALGDTLSHMELFRNDSIGSLYLDAKTIEKLPKADTEGFVEYLQSIGSTKINFFCREIKPDVFRVSMRSKINVDVSKIAEHFGGGGHERAAGCTIHGTIDHVKKILVKEIELSMQ